MAFCPSTWSDRIRSAKEAYVRPVSGQPFRQLHAYGEMVGGPTPLLVWNEGVRREKGDEGGGGATGRNGGMAIGGGGHPVRNERG